MKNSILIGIIVVLIIGAIAFLVYKNNNNNIDISQNTNYAAQKSYTTENLTNNQNNITTNQNELNNLSNTTSENTIQIVDNVTSEEEIANFSTKIYTKIPNRQNNIEITCTTLNNTQVAPGTTFSFCDTVGKATSSKGYKEADIFNSDGEKVKGLGGGNCQVSTTLYNAVLKVPELKVTERHEHSNDVPYIQKGKDAAVAYGSYDFKFVNNTNSTIKIIAENTPDSVTIKLMRQ